jgi:hypothetical protein
VGGGRRGGHGTGGGGSAHPRACTINTWNGGQLSPGNPRSPPQPRHLLLLICRPVFTNTSVTSSRFKPGAVVLVSCSHEELGHTDGCVSGCVDGEGD